jgi:isopentenyl-diphosphate delta-isomerase
LSSSGRYRDDVATPDGGGPELVVLLSEDGKPCGTALKSEVHHRNTPLHLAFSCWVLDDEGRTLLTRRAAVKRTWPGVWTNSFCGHPAPGEDVADAVVRRAGQELGCALDDLRLVLPDFRYRAVMDDGTVENEICPVYIARLDSVPDPDPAEVDGLSWVRLVDVPDLDPKRYGELSPWAREQLSALLLTR